MIRCRRKKLLLAAMAGGQPIPPPPTPPTPESILAKMSREQPQLYNYLMLWYDPKLQGLTNAQIEDATIGQGYFILRNLQGSTTYNMRVYGMTGEYGDGYVNEDGELVFDGVDDYGQSVSAIPFSTIGEFSTFLSINNISYDDAYYFVAASNRISMRVTNNNYMRVFIYGSAEATRRIYDTDLRFETYYPSDVAILNGEEVDVTRTRIVNTNIALSLAYNQNVYAPMNFSKFVFFTRDLTDTEAQWVRDNMINY